MSAKTPTSRSGRWRLTPFPVRLLAVAAVLLSPPPCRAEPPADADWMANAAVDGLVTASDPSLAHAQGVSYREGRLYFYGDVYQARPRAGIIREYTLDLKATGRDIRLTRNGQPLLVHPTGLAWDRRSP